jgi:hypothetical protein
MGSCDWGRCHDCNGRVQNPYMLDFTDGSFGPLCDKCDSRECSKVLFLSCEKEEQVAVVSPSMPSSGRVEGIAWSVDNAIWFVCLGINDEWTTLDPAWVTELEEFISAQSQNFPLPRLKHWYQTGKMQKWKMDIYRIDPWAMTQTNCASGTVRPLMRCIVQAPVARAPLPSDEASGGGGGPAVPPGLTLSEWQDSAADAAALSQEQQTGAASSKQERHATTAPSAERECGEDYACPTCDNLTCTYYGCKVDDCHGCADCDKTESHVADLLSHMREEKMSLADQMLLARIPLV